MDQPISLYLVTGFLGSGKTTFLKNVLEEIQDKRVGVIVNEFGSVGIDGKVLQHGDLKLVEINNGSIFCSCLKSGFIKTLVAFLEQPIDVLFIEASGLADPSSMRALLDQINAQAAQKGLVQRRYDYRGSICIVDCTTFLEYCEVLIPTTNQVIKSNFILVNKTDQVDQTRIADIHEHIRTLNPKSLVYDTTYSRVPLSELEEKLTIGDDSLPSSNQPWNRPVTYQIDLEGVIESEQMLAFYQGLKERILRMKGFFKDPQGMIYLDAVEDSISLSPYDEAVHPTSPKAGMAIIGRDGTDFSGDIELVWQQVFAEKPLLLVE